MKNTVSNLREIAPAKINLHLKVTRRRADGYHELDISFLPLRELYDIVDIAFAPNTLEMSCSDPALPVTSDNLCLRAARRYSDAAGIIPEWHINLIKNIPLAAGLGGGSSDAAAVLRLLNGHYQALDEQQLAEVALGLGADVPFFLNPVPSRATGVGEKLEAFDFKLPELPLLLVNPAFPISAAWAYKHLSPSLIGQGEAFGAGDLDHIAAQIKNDLEPAVLDKFPILRIIKQAMLDCGTLTACMSGSGPTMFALCRSEDHLNESCEIIRKRFPWSRCFREMIR